jgi:hypothetical protein
MPKVAIISVDPLTHDARLQRQIKYLSNEFEVQVITNEQLDGPIEAVVEKASPEVRAAVAPVAAGGGLKDLAQKTGLHAVLKIPVTWLRRLRRPVLMMAGRILGARAYEAWYWGHFYFRKAYAHLVASRADIIHTSNWNTLPAAVKAAEQIGAKVVLDLREYSPLEFENRWYWKHFWTPLLDYFLRTYVPRTAAAITVCEPIAEKYAQEYGFRPVVIMNAPACDTFPGFHATNPERIQLVHHGAAIRDRKLELLIHILSKTDQRYVLNFFLVEFHPDYIAELKELAEKLVPGRVFFHKPVKPTEIVTRFGEFDMGIFILPGVSFNYVHALPNKFFDYVNAGLAVCIGPSPEMERLARQHGFGVIAPSFDPTAVAQALNRLDAAEIDRLKRAAIEARKILTADVEMEKFVAVYRNLLSTPLRPVSV